VVTFNPEWAAKNPEKAKAAANGYREREQKLEEQSIQIKKRLAKKYGIDESEIV